MVSYINGGIQAKGICDPETNIWAYENGQWRRLQNERLSLYRLPYIVESD